MRLLQLDQISPGLCAGQAVFSRGGELLLAPAAPVSRADVDRLKQRGVTALYVEDDDLADVTPRCVISAPVRHKITTGLHAASACIVVELSRSAPAVTTLKEARTRNDPLAEAGVFRSAEQAVGERSPAGEALRKVVGDIETLLDETRGQSFAAGIGNLRSHESYSFDHCIDVTAIGLLMARRLGWSEDLLHRFAVGLLLHDIGKLFVDPKLLNKPARLSDVESAEMRYHPALGRALVSAALPELGPLPATVAYQHHEKQDGSGYPRKLRGDNTLGGDRPDMIHDVASVTAVADVYDALVTDRPYRAGLPGETVARFIDTMAGAHLNAEAVALFKQTVAPNAICSEVVILTGRWTQHTAVVTDVRPPHLDRPTIRVIANSRGRRIAAVEIDLSVDLDLQIASPQIAAELRARLRQSA